MTQTYRKGTLAPTSPVIGLELAPGLTATFSSVETRDAFAAAQASIKSHRVADDERLGDILDRVVAAMTTDELRSTARLGLVLTVGFGGVGPK